MKNAFCHRVFVEAKTGFRAVGRLANISAWEFAAISYKIKKQAV